MTSAEEAKELLGLVATPSALVTGTLLGFADRAIRENLAKVSPTRMRFALAASVGALAVMGALAALMAPMAMGAVQGSVTGPAAVWLVFGMITLSVIGTLVYCVSALFRCMTELRRPSR